MREFIDIFSTPPVLIKKYVTDNIQDIVKYADSIEYYSSYTNKSSINTFVLNEPIFSNIKEFIENAILEYVSDIFNTDHKFAITQSWITKNNNSDRQEIHSHPGSILSGVFYIKTSSESGNIEFNRGRPPFDIQINSNCSNKYLSDRYTFPTTSGDLLIFPANLLHSVGINKTNETRYSLAFNSFPVLPLGSIDNLTYLF